ncbi:MAG: succinate--CoA ligase subunit beta [Elusimicrobia bacterium RIFCSPLOWO2_01_FULL_59_12]|nr:MAG: succinate--CoA ligase subunit beta [Elusimicrobia bacterium RIFCSPLOWO2_01_FULL_59_12]
MKLHEFQAKEILWKEGVPVPLGVPLLSLQEWPGVSAKLPPGPWVVKSQVHTGGRGKAGGILKAGTKADLESAVQSLFGKTLVTHQTGPGGVIVRKLYVEQALTVAQELYVACIMDRSKAAPVVMASREGGMDIEDIAKNKPDAILFETVDPENGLGVEAARALAQRLGLQGSAVESVAAVIQGVCKAFLAMDASLVEVNPLGVTSEGQAIAMDAKMTLDDNALFRHPEAKAWHDTAEDNPLEARAAQAGVNYIALDGNIGCMVNGAGLAMATMDLIKVHGGEPANFLDVGGGANTQQVTEAFRILLADPRVKAVLVNIFGGIMKCDVIATAIIAAAKEVGLRIPLVVRLEGTHVEEGRDLLNASGLTLTSAKDLTEAAERVVAAAKADN